MIPDILHFIYPLTPRTRPFSALNVLAVKRAATIQQPEKIWLWTNARPDEIQFFDQIADLVEIQPITLPEYDWPQYQADALRLEILFHHGGVYLDTDMLLLRPLSEYLGSDKLVFGWEDAGKTSISNALMLAPPANPFISAWARRIPETQGHPVWAWGGVVLPAYLAQDPALAETIDLHSNLFSCPLDLKRPWLIDPALKAEALARVENAVAIHAFETFWRNSWAGWQDKDCLLRHLAI